MSTFTEGAQMLCEHIGTATLSTDVVLHAHLSGVGYRPPESAASSVWMAMCCLMVNSSLQFVSIQDAVV